MSILQSLRTRFPLLPLLAGLFVVGTFGGAAARQYLGDEDCCRLGSSCCRPGAACCTKHHHHE